MKVHPVFNEILLKPAYKPVFEVQRTSPPPPPVIVENEEEYKVNEIIDSKLHHGKLQYLIKWTGYNEPTWQPEPDITNAKDVVNEFYRKHPGAPR